jgi:AraC-like DNA-binding protein
VTNKEINDIIAESGIKKYEIASRIGITEYHICRLFRQELTEEYKILVMDAIKELLQEQKNKIEKILKTLEV